MSAPGVRPDPAFGLLKLYDEALPHAYGYLLSRCRNATLAEDLTADRCRGCLGAHHRAALTRVRAAGGSGAKPERKPHGLLVECVDDQGVAFQLWQPVD